MGGGKKNKGFRLKHLRPLARHARKGVSASRARELEAEAAAQRERDARAADEARLVQEQALLEAQLAFEETATPYGWRPENDASGDDSDYVGEDDSSPGADP